MTAKEYEQLLKYLYLSAKTEPTEIKVPEVQIMAVEGNEPPASQQFQAAIAALYGIGYTLKMGLKFSKLPRPAGYFDYKVGALEALWWSTTGEVDINDPKTLRWQAFLMLPPFVTQALFDQAVLQAKAKKPEVPYNLAKLIDFNEGRAVQMLHIGPYNQEEPTIKRLLDYVKDHQLKVSGHHHEIYLSDPRRTKPDKLKTVLRYAVK